MLLNTTGDGARAARSLTFLCLLSSILLILGPATGCALSRMDVRSLSGAPTAEAIADSVEPPEKETATVLEPRPEDEAFEETWLDDDLGAIADQPALEALPIAEDAEIAPDEGTVTESPLDELATASPELTPAELEKERERVAASAPAPAFDIPMEINDRVLAWVDLYSRNHKGSFEAGLARSGRYLEMFRRIFEEEGLPQDLVYMAHVESGYKTLAYSRAHARGIFQFIASTARIYDLRVDYWADERADPEKSARAAAHYMKKLYAEFGDWYLALAAYNAGEGKIRRALARSGRRDFWGIARTRYIRRETKNHIPAILAATLLSKDPEKYGLRYDPDPPVRYDTIEVDGAVDLRVLARCAGTDVDTMKQLNPALRRHQTPPAGRAEVRVPLGAGLQTLAALEQIPRRERVLYARHRVRRGDTLSAIARQYGVSVRSIQATNGMGRRTMIRINQVLKVPTSTSAGYAAADERWNGDGAHGEVLVYRIRRGDTLYGIARRHGTTPATLAAANGISQNKLLQIGERLKVVRGVRTPAEARRIVAGEAYASNGSPASGEVVHTVRRGDTLWGIASIYRTSVNTLCSLNQISPSTILHPGLKLTVRQN